MRLELPPTAGVPLRWGDLVPRGESDLAAAAAAWLGTDAALLTGSGAAALVVALEALKTLAPQRRTVAVPAYTCPLVPLAVVRAGLVPVPVDLAPGHFDLDPDALEAAVDADTLVVLPTHLAGQVADVDAARAVAARHGAFVIEDAAQAFGAALGRERVGLAGDIGLFSFGVGKGLTIYEGGLLVARDPAVRAALREAAARLLHPHPLHETKACIELLGYAALYRPSLLGLVYGRPLRRALARRDVIAACRDNVGLGIPLHRPGRWRARVGVRALARLHAAHASAGERAARRMAALEALPGVRFCRGVPGSIPVWPYLLVHLPDEACRDAALARLWPSGLGVGRLFAHALPDYPFLRGVVPATAVPHARNFAARTLTISNSPWLDDARFARIVDVLRQTLRLAAKTGAG
ncbi:MAG TPA: aminotransferase class I/II-fold pyridoxal phosphate-dependent enzyme [Rhodanobacteraceae bacterium]|nr:aminotransferase class I/II-fold pyridoxal phosphate-dependent enzyme [Rhodanobacteraceae bacterium]